MDISGLTNELLQGLGVVALAMLLLAGKMLVQWMGLKLTADQANALDTVASNALDWAISHASDEIATKGWDHPAVKSSILAAALTYAQDNAAGGLKRAGIDTSTRLASAEALAPVLQRSFADAMGRAAASPATPPAGVAVMPAPVSAPIPVSAVGDPARAAQ
jgi:hypothetical protein